jgi:hypothetical protein
LPWRRAGRAASAGLRSPPGPAEAERRPAAACTTARRAGIGFWNTRNGQALLKNLNGGTGTQLADWLAATLPDTFGKNAANDVAGQGNAYIAALFQNAFVMKGVKLDAQVLATALSVYATNATLDPTKVAASYGFTVSGDGAGRQVAQQPGHQAQSQGRHVPRHGVTFRRGRRQARPGTSRQPAQATPSGLPRRSMPFSASGRHTCSPTARSAPTHWPRARDLPAARFDGLSVRAHLGPAPNDEPRTNNRADSGQNTRERSARDALNLAPKPGAVRQQGRHGGSRIGSLGNI